MSGPAPRRAAHGAPAPVGRPLGRRPRRGAHLVLAASAALLAGCGPSAPASPPGGAPEGFVVDAGGLPPVPAMATLTAGVVPPPAAMGVTRYVPAANGPGAAAGALTATVATFADPGGAIGAYNGWFAAWGFPAVAERRALPIGEAAERFDLAWPPLHAVVARAGARFVLVEGDDALPAAARAPAMATLAAAGLSAPPATPPAP